MMNKRIVIILSSMIMLITSVVLLIAFIFLPQRKTNMIASTIFLSVRNQELHVGEELHDYYYINTKDVKITFDVDKPNIIDINEERILGLNEGVVNVTMTAENTIGKTEEKFSVKVLSNDARVVIEGLDQCVYYEYLVELDVFSKDCQFKLSLYVNDELIEYPEFYITTNSDVDFEPELGGVSLFDVHDCKLTINFPRYKYSITINVLCYF